MPTQAPNFETDFAMARPAKPGGFLEEDLPPVGVTPGFSEENLPEANVTDFVKGTIESASDEALSEAPKHLQTPESINSLLQKGQLDSSDEGGFTDSLTSSEKIALGLLAIMPLLGGVLGGGEEGALLGAGAAGQGLEAFGKVKLQQGKQNDARLAAEAKFLRSEDRFNRAEAGRDRRAGLNRASRNKRDEQKETALDIPGRGKARTQKEAISFREAVTAAENAKADLRKVKELGKGVTIFDRKKIGLIQQNLMTAIGKLRLSVLGPGVMTESERAFLRENIGDPSTLFSTEAIQNAKLDQLINQIEASIDRQANQIIVPSEGVGGGQKKPSSTSGGGGGGKQTLKKVNGVWKIE